METRQIGDLVFVVAPEEVGADGKESSFPDSELMRQSKAQKFNSQAENILARAKMLGLEEVCKVGEGALIDQPIETNGWLVMPPEMFKRIIPPEAWHQAENLTHGIPIKGFLVAEDKRRIEPRPSNKVWALPEISPDWGKIATGAGKVAAVIAVGMAVIAFFPIILGIGAVGAALTYDPLLLAVTAEDEWIAVAEWWD